MDIIIGREEHTSEPRLRLIVDGKEKFLATKTHVPKTVSRRHCLLSVNGDEIVVKNMKEGANPIFVNGLEVERKRIKKEDIIQLGLEKYSVDVAVVLSVLNDDGAVSIAHLEKVYNDYNETIVKMQERDRKNNAVSRIVSSLLMGAGAISFVIPTSDNGIGNFINVIRVTLFAVAIVLAIIGFRDTSNPRKLQELKDKYLDDYVCPKCGRSLGTIRYKELAKYVACPYCKVKFKH